MPQTAKSREEMVLASIEPRGLPLREQVDEKKKKPVSFHGLQANVRGGWGVGLATARRLH